MLPFLWPFFASSYFENRVDKQNNFNAHTSMDVESEKRKHCEVYDAINSVLAQFHEP